MTASTDRFAQARARQALRLAGFDDPASLEAASSTRNEVFLADDVVVRVNRQPNQRLRREALLCQHLPQRHWTPRILAYGGRLGADYLIVARRPGMPLSRCWPDMTQSARRSAIAQLAAALTVLHQTATPLAVPPLDQAPQLLDPRRITPLAPLLVAVDKLGTLTKSGVDKSLFDDLAARIYQIGNALNDYDQRYLIHGDLSFENLLWDGSTLSAVLDFEWCRGAPADLDLDVLLRFCALPHAHVAPDYEHRTRQADYLDVPVWLAEDRPDLFSHPHIADRLELYSISYCVQELMMNESLLDLSAADRGPLHPVQRLIDVLCGASHLEAIFHRVGLTV